MIEIKLQKCDAEDGHCYEANLTTANALEFETVKYFIQLLTQELDKRNIKWQ